MGKLVDNPLVTVDELWVSRSGWQEKSPTTLNFLRGVGDKDSFLYLES